MSSSNRTRPGGPDVAMPGDADAQVDAPSSAAPATDPAEPAVDPDATDATDDMSEEEAEESAKAHVQAVVDFMMPLLIAGLQPELSKCGVPAQTIAGFDKSFDRMTKTNADNATSLGALKDSVRDYGKTIRDQAKTIADQSARIIEQSNDVESTRRELSRARVALSAANQALVSHGHDEIAYVRWASIRNTQQRARYTSEDAAQATVDAAAQHANQATSPADAITSSVSVVRSWPAYGQPPSGEAAGWPPAGGGNPAVAPAPYVVQPVSQLPPIPLNPFNVRLIGDITELLEQMENGPYVPLQPTAQDIHWAFTTMAERTTGADFVSIRAAVIAVFVTFGVDAYRRHPNFERLYKAEPPAGRYGLAQNYANQILTATGQSGQIAPDALHWAIVTGMH